MSRSMSNYDKRPIIRVSEDASLCIKGWDELTADLRRVVQLNDYKTVAVEVYPGIDSKALTQHLKDILNFKLIVQTEDAFLPPDTLREKFGDSLSDDPVSSFMHSRTMDAYFDEEKLTRQRCQIDGAVGYVLIVGTGASLVSKHADLLISANVSRWEIQRRQRAHLIANLGFDNQGARPAELYKTAFFLDWRVADRVRHDIYTDVDFFIDMTTQDEPRMLPGNLLCKTVSKTVKRPFRMMPFFDPGPWGGQWMRTKFNLPEGPQNYAWGFDCVPEENSVLFGFGDREFELPAIVLVHEEPEALLGKAYIRDHFGMQYTQDESYYMFHREPGTSMYLGLVEHTSQKWMTQALYEANYGGAPFPADEFVARWPTAIRPSAARCAG